ncbi:MAG: 50S ribosomal protein L30 [Euryarchaeota archaeon]|nr:50S ribosomal protein L30 [Euryarchaeota archaeon]
MTRNERSEVSRNGFKRIAVVRVRGRARVREDVEDTLKMLRLTRVNYCTIIDDREAYQGMLGKIKDYATWGEVDEEDVATILKNRGELAGGEKITDAYVKKNTKHSSINAFAKAFINFKAELQDIPNLNLFFRLHPPRKGYEGIKRSIKEGGALGNRGKLKELIYRMR